MDPRDRIEYVAEMWDPTRRPVHCSNCANTRVSGDPDNPRIRCARNHGGIRGVMGEGRVLSYWMLMREKRPMSFRPAADCEDFESMNDD